MGFLAKLRQFLFGAPGAAHPAQAAAGDPYGLWFHFRCDHCGSVVRIRVDKRNDLDRGYEGLGAAALHKEIMDNKCFRLIRAELTLDASYQLITAVVDGGLLITREEYEAALKSTTAA